MLTRKKQKKETNDERAGLTGSQLAPPATQLNPRVKKLKRGKTAIAVRTRRRRRSLLQATDAKSGAVVVAVAPRRHPRSATPSLRRPVAT
jgi:hypothetical protein